MAKAPELTVEDGDAGLRIIGLRKSYRKKPVIREVDLELHRGEVVALLGPNGCGKSTTFYAIAGLITPEAGQVIIDGRDVTLLPMYRRARYGIGYLPQEMSIFRGMSVEDNILAILEISTPDRHKRRERLEELLNEFFNQPPKTNTCPCAVRWRTAPSRNCPTFGIESQVFAIG